MNRYILIPENTTLEFILIILAALLFILILFFMFLSTQGNKKRINKMYLNHFFKKFIFDLVQKQMVTELFNEKPNINIEQFFNDEFYFDYNVREYLKRRLRSGHSINDEMNEFNLIKKKITFTHLKSHSSRDLKADKRVKIQVNNVGFFTGKIINNDNNGILINVNHNPEMINNLKKNTPAVIYYWDDFVNYEINTHIKQASTKQSHYILFAHDEAMNKGNHPKGIGISTEIRVFFSHIFDLPENDKIETHVLRGLITEMSMIGMEIFTRFKVKEGGIYLFEFRDVYRKRNRNRFHFTGRVEYFEKIGNGRKLFVKIINMNEKCRNYIYRFICNKINELAIERHVA